MSLANNKRHLYGMTVSSSTKLTRDVYIRRVTNRSNTEYSPIKYFRLCSIVQEELVSIPFRVDCTRIGDFVRVHVHI